MNWLSAITAVSKLFGALILAQPAIKVIVTKSIQMGNDFGHPFGSSLSGFECR